MIDEDSEDLFVGDMAIEIQIKSDIEFNIFLFSLSKQNITSVKHFSNVHGHKYLEFNSSSDQNLKIIFEKIKEEEEPEELESESFLNDTEMEKDQSKVDEGYFIQLSYTLKIIKLNQTQNYCPFNCYGNGRCNQDGVCQCINGFSPLFNCLIKMEDVLLEINENMNIYDVSNENKKSSDSLLKYYDSVFWKYVNLEILNIEELKSEIFQRQQYQDNIHEIQISFKYSKNLTYMHQPSIRILDYHNYFKILETEEYLGDDQYVSIFSIMNIDYYKLFTDPKSKGKLMAFAYNKNLNNLQVQIQAVYNEFSLLYEYIELLVVAFSVVLLFVFLAIACKQKEEYMNISSQQGSQQMYLSHQKNIGIQNIMENQLKSYIYHIQSQKDLENGSFTECFICLSTYEESDELCKTKCGHVFHKQCLKAWISKNQVCPIDRNCILDGKPIAKQLGGE